MFSKRGNKKGQLAAFIIIALVIVAGILAYFLIRDRIGISVLPTKFQPIEQYFIDCVEEQARIGIDFLGSRAGYIELPEFSAGSAYRPFSSQLDFLGTPIPYWYYVSGNNIIKEQAPSKTEMQEQLADFVENVECDFSQFELEGYEIGLAMSNVKASILDNKVELDIDADLNIILDQETGKQSKHKTFVQSSLGKMYDEALNIYNYEKQTSFLENYAVDVLRLYAPVDGVEIDCAPKIWMKNEVDDELKQGLEANMLAIKLTGDYYKNADKYFIQDLSVENSVNFLYSRNWPTRIEVWESKSGVMLAEPIGNQAGLGILGFCYVPYHFVYDVNYPVLIQIYNQEELFQFPVAVIIEKNKPREALPSTALEKEIELCKYANQDVIVYTYDNNLEPVEAEISFECLRQSCEIGTSKIEGGDAVLEAKLPSCANGYVIARADGYAEKKILFSSNEERVADVILNKLYELDADLKVNGETTDDNAIIIFNSEENPRSIAWPEMKTIQLSEGWYNVSVYVYRSSGIIIPSSKTQKCVEVAKPGIAGLFGATTEQCYDITTPSQELENVISGGGKVNEYITEMQLKNGKLEIDVSGFAIPSSLEMLQNNYNLLETKSVYLNFEK